MRNIYAHAAIQFAWITQTPSCNLRPGVQSAGDQWRKLSSWNPWKTFFPQSLGLNATLLYKELVSVVHDQVRRSDSAEKASWQKD